MRTGGLRTIKVLQGYIYYTVSGLLHRKWGEIIKNHKFKLFENRFEKKDSFKGTVECRDRPATLH